MITNKTVAITFAKLMLLSSFAIAFIFIGAVSAQTKAEFRRFVWRLSKLWVRLFLHILGRCHINLYGVGINFF